MIIKLAYKMISGSRIMWHWRLG